MPSSLFLVVFFELPKACHPWVQKGRLGEFTKSLIEEERESKVVKKKCIRTREGERISTINTKKVMTIFQRQTTFMPLQRIYLERKKFYKRIYTCIAHILLCMVEIQTQLLI